MTDFIVQPEDVIHVLRRFKNAILEGVPGTGKTFAIWHMASAWTSTTGRPLIGDGQGSYAITMHPSTAYEDFVEGLRYDDSARAFVRRDGFIVRVVKEALGRPDADFLVLLDEINRANVPKVLGDLLVTLEKTKRANYRPSRGWIGGMQVTLPYSGRIFEMPENLYIVGTMNTTDQSIAPLDSALRRRFAFVRLEPLGKADLLKLVASHTPLMRESVRQLTLLNEAVLKPLLGPDAMLGHSYLIGIENDGELRRSWRLGVVPQLVDVAHAYGGEQLLDPRTRAEWLAAHGTAESPELAAFDDFLASIGIGLVVEGTAASTALRVVGVKPALP
jgi:dynein-related subfamily AAA family protein